MIGRIVRALKAVERVLVPIESFMTLVLMLAISYFVAAGIVFRILSIAVPWTNEAAQLLLVWLMFIGATLGIYHREHVGVTMLADRLDGRARAVLLYAAQLGVLVFCVYVVVSGTSFVKMLRVMGGTTFALPIDIPKYVIAMVLPVSFLAGTVHVLRQILEMDWRAVPRGAGLGVTEDAGSGEAS